VDALESYHAFCYALRLLFRCQLARLSHLPQRMPDLINLLLELSCRHRNGWPAARCVGGSVLSVEYECAVWPQSADFEGAVWFGGNSRRPRNMFCVTEGVRMLRCGRAGWFRFRVACTVDGFVEFGSVPKATPAKTRETHHRQRRFLAFDCS
jgi:hypothetical protein